jgi:hypothetical protein
LIERTKLALLAAAVLAVAPPFLAPPALGATFGPDLPGWMLSGPAAADASPEDGAAHDALTRAHAQLARGQELAQSGHLPEALSAVRLGIASLDSLPPSRPGVPSVLIELGYVSNRDDLKQMTSDKWRVRTANAIVQAVNTYFATRLAGRAEAR